MPSARWSAQLYLPRFSITNSTTAMPPRICERLDQRNIPFVIYSGYDHVEGPCSEGEHVRKPVPPPVLVDAVVELLRKPSDAR